MNVVLPCLSNLQAHRINGLLSSVDIARIQDCKAAVQNQGQPSVRLPALRNVDACMRLHAVCCTYTLAQQCVKGPDLDQRTWLGASNWMVARMSAASASFSENSARSCDLPSSGFRVNFSTPGMAGRTR